MSLVWERKVAAVTLVAALGLSACHAPAPPPPVVQAPALAVRRVAVRVAHPRPGCASAMTELSAARKLAVFRQFQAEQDRAAGSITATMAAVPAAVPATSPPDTAPSGCKHASR